MTKLTSPINHKIMMIKYNKIIKTMHRIIKIIKLNKLMGLTVLKNMKCIILNY